MPRIWFKMASRMGLMLLAALPVGCTHFDPVGGSALVGSGLGAATGAVIGHQSGNTGAGALLGATAGAIGGALVGETKQARYERDAAFAYADSQRYQAAANSVTNSDVIYMTQNGLSEEVIINAIHTRGGRFDTSPTALTTLHTSGVSNTVIGAMQTADVPPAPVYSPPPVPPRRSRVVVVEQAPPPIVFGIGSSHCYHHCAPRRRRCRPRSGLFIHGHFD